jgi:hypothetical protein
MATLILDEDNIIIDSNQIMLKGELVNSKVIKNYKGLETDRVSVIVKKPRDFESAFDILVKFNYNGRENLLFEMLTKESVKKCLELRDKYFQS